MPDPRYDPNREAMFAQILAQGRATPNFTLGDTIGGLAQQIAGTIGMRRQGKARQRAIQADAAKQSLAQQGNDQALASVLAGFGLPVDPATAGTLAANPSLLGEAFSRQAEDRQRADQRQAQRRERRQARRAERRSAADAQAQADAQINFLAERGIDPERAAQAVSAGPEFVRQLLAPEETPERQIIKAADGYNYYTDTGERVIPGAEIPQEAPEQPSAPTGYRWTGDGNLEPIPGGPAASGGTRRLSEQESKLLQFTGMLDTAINTLEGQDESGNRLFDIGSSTAQRLAGSGPGGNFRTSADYQRFNQSMRDAASALLRLETGAAATEFEVEDLMNRYSPQPGDRPETIQQKLDALKRRYETAKSLVPGQGAPVASAPVMVGDQEISPDNPFYAQLQAQQR